MYLSEIPLIVLVSQTSRRTDTFVVLVADIHTFRHENNIADATASWYISRRGCARRSRTPVLSERLPSAGGKTLEKPSAFGDSTLCSDGANDPVVMSSVAKTCILSLTAGRMCLMRVTHREPSPSASIARRRRRIHAKKGYTPTHIQRALSMLLRASCTWFRAVSFKTSAALPVSKAPI